MIVASESADEAGRAAETKRYSEEAMNPIRHTHSATQPQPVIPATAALRNGKAESVKSDAGLRSLELNSLQLNSTKLGNANQGSTKLHSVVLNGFGYRLSGVSFWSSCGGVCPMT